MAARDNRSKERGENRHSAGQESSERLRMLSFLQTIARSVRGGSYAFDPTGHTIVLHPDAYQQSGDDHLATSLRLLLDSTDEGIYGLDLGGCCRFTNQAGGAMLGYQPEELRGRNMHQLIHHSYGDGSPYPEAACPIFRAFLDGHGIRLDTEVLWRRDGTAFPAEYSAYPISEHGQIQGAVVTFRDITKRKQAERALRESEQRKAAILEAALDAVITMDQQGAILEFNPAAECIFGYRRAEVLGQELASLIIPPSLREQHRQGLASYLIGGDGPLIGKRVELMAMRADGNEFPIEISITQISHAGPPLFTGFIRDLAEREQAITKDWEQIAREPLHDSSHPVLGDDSTQNHEEDEHQRWFTGPNQVAAQKVTLTKKERAVLELLVQDGGTNQELAERLMVSESTIHHHLRNILQKLHLQNRTQLAVYAIRHGLFGPPTSSS